MLLVAGQEDLICPKPAGLAQVLLRALPWQLLIDSRGPHLGELATARACYNKLEPPRLTSCQATFGLTREVCQLGRVCAQFRDLKCC